HVVPGSNLEHALSVGDVITAFNGAPVTNSVDLFHSLQSLDNSLNSFVIATNKLATLQAMLQLDPDKTTSSTNSEILQAPGYCTSYTTLERLSAIAKKREPLACCKQVLAPWVELDTE